MRMWQIFHHQLFFLFKSKEEKKAEVVGEIIENKVEKAEKTEEGGGKSRRILLKPHIQS